MLRRCQSECHKSHSQQRFKIRTLWIATVALDQYVGSGSLQQIFARAGEKCWEDVQSNKSSSAIHTDGCYSIVEQYVVMEIWVLLGVAGLCALLQALAIGLLCLRVKERAQCR